jgi:hypothetical protein
LICSMLITPGRFAADESRIRPEFLWILRIFDEF